MVSRGGGNVNSSSGPLYEELTQKFGYKCSFTVSEICSVSFILRPAVTQWFQELNGKKYYVTTECRSCVCMDESTLSSLFKLWTINGYGAGFEVFSISPFSCFTQSATASEHC